MKIEAHKAVQVTDIEKAKDLVVAALKNDLCKIDVVSPSSLSAKRGSQLKMRTIGGMFIGLKDLPVKITVEFTSSSGINQVDISAFDDMGFGSKAGMTDKYQTAVLDLLEVAVNSISSLSSVSLSSPEEKPKSFCSSCGTKVEASGRFCSSCGQTI